MTKLMNILRLTVLNCFPFSSIKGGEGGQCMYSLQISLDKETTESITSILYTKPLRYKPTKRVAYNLKVERLFLLKKKD